MGQIQSNGIPLENIKWFEDLPIDCQKKVIEKATLFHEKKRKEYYIGKLKEIFPNFENLDLVFDKKGLRSKLSSCDDGFLSLNTVSLYSVTVKDITNFFNIIAHCLYNSLEEKNERKFIFFLAILDISFPDKLKYNNNLKVSESENIIAYMLCKMVNFERLHGVDEIVTILLQRHVKKNKSWKKGKELLDPKSNNDIVIRLLIGIFLTCNSRRSKYIGVDTLFDTPDFEKFFQVNKLPKTIIELEKILLLKSGFFSELFITSPFYEVFKKRAPLTAEQKEKLEKQKAEAERKLKEKMDADKKEADEKAAAEEIAKKKAEVDRLEFEKKNISDLREFIKKYSLDKYNISILLKVSQNDPKWKEDTFVKMKNSATEETLLLKITGNLTKQNNDLDNDFYSDEHKINSIIKNDTNNTVICLAGKHCLVGKHFNCPGAIMIPTSPEMEDISNQMRDILIRHFEYYPNNMCNLCGVLCYTEELLYKHLNENQPCSQKNIEWAKAKNFKCERCESFGHRKQYCPGFRCKVCGSTSHSSENHLYRCDYCGQHLVENLKCKHNHKDNSIGNDFLLEEEYISKMFFSNM